MGLGFQKRSFVFGTNKTSKVSREAHAIPVTIDPVSLMTVNLSPKFKMDGYEIPDVGSSNKNELIRIICYVNQVLLPRINTLQAEMDVLKKDMHALHFSTPIRDLCNSIPDSDEFDSDSEGVLFRDSESG